MSLKITPQIFKWLQSLSFVKQAKRNNDFLQLSEEISAKFFDGNYIGVIIKTSISHLLDQQSTKKLQSLKQNSNPAIRLYNWNILLQILKKYKITTIDSTQKSKIVNLEYEPVLKVLKGIFQNRQNKAQQKQKKGLKVQITQINKKTITQTNNAMQFLIILLSKNFKLSPQHTLNLFIDNNKYLSHLLVKGVKNNYQPIYQFINDIKFNLDYLISHIFCIDQEQNVNFFFNALKSCIISKDSHTVNEIIQLLIEIDMTYRIKNISTKHLKKWLKSEGINSIFFTLTKNGEYFQRIIELCYNYLDLQLFQYFQYSQKNLLWSNDRQKLNIFRKIITLQNKQIFNKFVNSNNMQEWLKYFIKNHKKLKQNDQLHDMNIIFQNLWLLMQDKFEDQTLNLVNSYVQFMKQLLAMQNYVIFMSTSISLFNLIKVLGTKKNSNAPNLYRITVTVFNNIQSNDEQKITFMCQNLIKMLKQIKNLPGGALVPPIVKHLSSIVNPYLIQLCKSLFQQKRLDEQQSVQVLQILTKIIFQDCIYSQMANDVVFQYIPSLNDQIADEYLLNNSKVTLSKFVSNSKNITKTVKQLKNQYQIQQKNSSPNQQTKGKQKILTQLKKSLLVRNYLYFLNKYLDVDDINLKNSLETGLFHTYIKVKIENKKKKVADYLMPLLKRYYDNDDDLNNQIADYQRQNYPPQDGSKQVSPNKITLLKSMRSGQSLDLSQLQNNQYRTIDPSSLKPSIFALKDLQTLKLKKQNLKTIQLSKQKKSLQSQIKSKQIKNLMNQKRVIQFGSVGKVDFQYKNLYDFDTMKQEEIISGVPMIKLVNFQRQEEVTYQDDLKNIMKKYRKVWRFLFFKYSTFGAKKQQFKTQQKINMAEIWKMIRQYQIFGSLKKQQSQMIIKLINDLMKRKNDPQNLTYAGFEQYIAQLCCYAYSKTQYPHVPSGRQVLLFIQQLKKQTRQKGGSVQLFQNPEDVYFQQTDVIRQYNKRLRQNPEYILPQGYKKYKQQNLQYQYNIHPMLQKNIPNNYIQVYQVLHQILFQKLQMSLIQPLTIKTQVTLAKPMLFQNLADKMKDYKKGYLLNKSTIEVKQQKEKQLKKSIILIRQFKPHINFSLGIKMGLSSVSVKNKSIAEEVAYWMHDMLNAVQKESLKVQPKKKPDNTLIRKRRVQSLQKLKKQRSEKKQWKKRAESVKLRLQLQKKVKQQQSAKKKQQEIEEKRKVRARQQQALRKKLTRFEQMKKIMGQKKQQIKYRKIQQEDKRKQRLQSYRQKVAQYFQKKKQQILEKQQALKQKKQQEQKQKQQKRQKQQKFKKQLYLSNLKKQQNIIQKAEQLKQQYQQLWQSQEIEKQFKKHQKQLIYLFNLLLKHQKSKISATNFDEIGLNTLHYFAIKFMIVPFMVQKNQLIYIFNFIIKNKQKKKLEESNQKQNPQPTISSPSRIKHPGLNFKDFQQTLFLIVVKAKKMLNKIKQKREKRLQKMMQFLKQKKADGGQNHFDVEDISESSDSQSDQEPEQQQKPPGLLSKYLYNVQDVDEDTLEQIFVFLKLPKDKTGVQQRYKAVIESKNLKPKNILKIQLKKQMETVKIEDIKLDQVSQDQQDE